MEQRFATLMGAETMKTTCSSASLSTRVTSTDSLCDLGTLHAGCPTSTPAVAVARSTSTPRRFRRVLLLVLAAGAYVWWSRYVLRMSKKPRSFGPYWLARCVAGALSTIGWCLGIRGIKDVTVAPDRIPDEQAMICMHPHGLCGIGPLLLHCNEPRRQGGPMENVMILAADAVFNIPILREIMLFINARAATASVVNRVLGTGASVALFPGGIHEQLRTDPGQEKLSFPPNLGFVREAIKHGIPIVPLYSFGENQQFDVPQWSRRISDALKDKFGLGVPFGIGRCCIPFVPKAFPIQSRLGRAIDTSPADPNPSEARIKQVFYLYCAELQRLFEEYKDDALPAAVASRGLELVWRGHEDEDLSFAALNNKTQHELKSAHAVLPVLASRDGTAEEHERTDKDNHALVTLRSRM